MSFLYSIYDATLSSCLELPELQPSQAPQAEFTFASSQRGSLRGVQSWLQEVPKRWAKPGDVLESMQLARLDDCYLVRFPGLVDFEVSLDGRRIEAIPLHRLTDTTLRHLLIDQVLPRAIGHRGQWIIHASAVATAANQALLFTAPSGTGKSTLASALIHAGCRLLNDDGILLRTAASGDFECVAGYPGVRLWNDSADHLFGPDAALAQFAQYSEKNRISLTRNAITVASTPTPLRCFYLLERGAQDAPIEISPLAPREACLELVRCTFLLDPTDAEQLRANFSRCTQLAARSILFRLKYPSDLARLPEVVEAVLRHAAGSDAAGRGLAAEPDAL